MSTQTDAFGTTVPRRRRSRAPKGRMAGVNVRGTPVSAGRRASVVLASEGRPFTAAAIARAGDLAQAADSSVLVLSVARVHGVGFGMQTPGLMPTKAEWDEQRDAVAKATAKLKRRGLTVEGQVLGTRHPAKRICALATELGAGSIVMGADAPRTRLIRSFMWTQEPQAVATKAKIPVHLLIE